MSPSSHDPSADGPRPRPNLEHHRKLARSLLRDHAAGEHAAARRFINYHPRFRGLGETEALRRAVKLADAQLVVAREARFESWPRLRRYIDSVSDMPDDDAAVVFESAADHIVNGRIDALRAMLDEHPDLVTRRSPRPHGATLLHYVAANGVEDHRQKTPPNAVAVSDLLIDRGADIHATAGFYGSGPGSTPLVALVTSGHPAEAGLMRDLVRSFARSSASLDGVEPAGSPMLHAFMFRHVDAAETLAECGAPVRYAFLAAGLGDVELTRRLLSDDRPPRAEPGPLDGYFGRSIDPVGAAQHALVLAAMAGRIEIVRELLDRGVAVDGAPYKGWSALHEASYAGRLDVVRLLLDRGAPLDRRDQQWSSTPIEWAAAGGRREVAELLRDAEADRS